MPSLDQKWALALELIKLESVASRVQSAMASMPAEHDYKGTKPRRQPRIKGAGAPFLVVNNDQRAVKATTDHELAEFTSSNYGGRTLLDLRELSRWNRRKLANALRANLGGTKAQMPAIEPKAIPKPSKPADPQAKLNELLSDIRHEVALLKLPEQTSIEVTNAAANVARVAGWNSASELLLEIKMLMYTDVKDLLTGDVESFDNAEDAAEYKTLMNEAPGGVLEYASDGEPLRFRFTTVRPNMEEQDEPK